MIKYLGSKRVLVPRLVGIITAMRPESTVIDLFSGTSRVGHGLKAAGHRVRANDHNAYAATLARCYVATDAARLDEVAELIELLSQVPPEPGYFTRTFCEQARFFQPHNGARVDAMRRWIAEAAETGRIDAELESVLLVSLMEAADRVDSTTGVQMAYLKSWARRSHNDLALRVPALLPQATAGKGEATQLDAVQAAATLTGHVAYLDPPYNQHKYVGNYHIWETLVRWDAPDTYGKAMKRTDCKTRRSDFNRRRHIAPALAQVVSHLDADHLVVSFSNEGFVDRTELEALLSTRGEVLTLSFDHARYVGARIGIYSPSGAKVGAVSHTRNTEHVFVVSRDTAALDRVRAAMG